QNDVTLKMPAFEWVHVQLHQQKGMISLSPPTICNSAFHYGESWNLLRADQRLIFAKSWPRASRYQQGHQDLFILRSDLPSQVFIRRKVRRVMLPTY
ncbi:hypothetical protein, partial [Klebsiella quasipneumoniae]|uniref:hypothetical protein n=1 Tax=Klebsiella quasipneumoniae TaxID=1463165 RepID=UPI0038CF455A